MPKIPLKNFRELEEEDLNRAKKRINKLYKLQESPINEFPDYDPSEGDADKKAEDMIKIIDGMEQNIQVINGTMLPYVLTRYRIMDRQSYHIAVFNLGALEKNADALSVVVNKAVKMFNYMSLSNMGQIQDKINSLTGDMGILRNKFNVLSEGPGGVFDEDQINTLKAQFQKTDNIILSSLQKMVYMVQNYVEVRVPNKLPSTEPIDKKHSLRKGVKFDRRPRHSVN